jgi:hypothetical protein
LIDLGCTFAGLGVREISREQYETQFGRLAADDPAVQGVVGAYLSARAFDEAYARHALRGFSHEDAVRAAQEELYGQVRSQGVGPQGAENRRAIREYQAAGGGGSPPRPPITATSAGMSGLPPAARGRMAGLLLAAALAGGGALIGNQLVLNQSGGME